ncbi:FHA domain-containing protein [Microbacterium sp. EF45047]|uniref:FHA domain-containing protein n=1 Tax=Microbacterium sp. EF45047 TaxID=2809708 RepID=UPI00234B66C3|nr:FHA domain-containing protein [Microbacterium sp. EF45047]WCM55891.1 FHA domain-containing protein [Microbacterium sp. EF45047]
MQTTYRPGSWYLIAMPGVLVTVPAEAEGEIVRALWDRLAEKPSLATAIDVLAGGAGSFTGMPSFAAAIAEGEDVRVAVRGEVAVTVTADAGSETVSGADVTTWSERFAANATRVEIAAEEPASPAALPLQSGIVLAASAEADLRADSDPLAPPVFPATGAEPQTDAEPVEASHLSTSSGSESQPDAEPVEASPVSPEPSTSSESEPAAPAADNGVTLLPTEVTYAPAEDDFDQLFGATVHTPPKPPAPPAPVSPAPAPPVFGDHDGATIAASELRNLRQAPPAAPPEAPTAVIPVAPSGRIRVSTGQVVTLDRTVIIGRRPRSTRASGANMPHLVAVESPQQDISRSHLEIRPEGDTVVVVDLHTTNGSTLLRAGADPVRLHPGEPTIVVSGDVVDLGDGVTVAFEDLP